MTTKREAQAALDRADWRTLQSVIDAMPDDPESRAERLGRIAFDGFLSVRGISSDWKKVGADDRNLWIAAAAAVEAECPKPREVTAEWVAGQWRDWHEISSYAVSDRINRYVRGEDA